MSEQGSAFCADTSLTITKWTEIFHSVYGGSDRKRKPEDFWYAVMAHVSTIGESIRRGHYDSLLKSAAHAFCWMCSYVSACWNLEDDVFSLRHGLSEIVALKFPTKCGHCKGDRCACDGPTMDAQDEKSAGYKWNFEYAREKHIDFDLFTMNEWLKTFRDIFIGRIHLQTMDSIGFHLLEEAGEEAKAVRQLVQLRGAVEAGVLDKPFLQRISRFEGLLDEYSISIEFLKQHHEVATEKAAKRALDPTVDSADYIKARVVMAKMDFVIEQADTFSWLCAVLLKLGAFYDLNGPDNRQSGIEGKIKEIYGYDENTDSGKCYACQQSQCKCVFYPG